MTRMQRNSMTAFRSGFGRGVGKGQPMPTGDGPGRYIPGLTNPPPPPPPINDSADDGLKVKDIPEELIRAFRNETKHPVSAVMEYAAIAKLDVKFEEAIVEQPSIQRVFAIVCRINGRQFPQGAGKTKKDAKTEAAKIAFQMLTSPTSANLLTEISGIS